MHLPNGDHAVRFGGVPNHTTEKEKSALNGMLQKPSIHTSSPIQPNEIASTKNEVSITLPHLQDLDTVLGSILTAWAVLIQRYQRDMFHQFTWGQKSTGEHGFQCIQSTELELTKHADTLSLYEKIQRLRSSHVDAKPDMGVFLNDGTPAEVCG